MFADRPKLHSFFYLELPNTSTKKPLSDGDELALSLNGSIQGVVTMANNAVLVKFALPALFLCGSLFAQEAAAAQPLPLSQIVLRMEAAQAQKHEAGAYELIKQFRVAGAKSSQADSEVVAAVNFEPPSSRSYTIQKSTGSSRGEQVVRHVLQQETQASDKEIEASAVNTQNYNFSYLGEAISDGQACYRLALQPKRKEKNLVVGEALVDQRTFQVRRILGDLAKTPSWWLKKVHVEMGFGNVQGAWLETNLRAEADVRIFGPHTLTSELLDYRGADVLANLRSSSSHSSRRRAKKADPAYSAVFTR